MLDPAIKLRHLVAFLTVARVAGFARAAADLRVSQPAVSKTIRELEDVLESVRLILKRSFNLSRWAASHFRAGVCRQQPDTR